MDSSCPALCPMSAGCVDCDTARILSENFSLFDFVPEANRLTGESKIFLVNFNYIFINVKILVKVFVVSSHL